MQTYNAGEIPPRPPRTHLAYGRPRPDDDTPISASTWDESFNGSPGGQIALGALFNALVQLEREVIELRKMVAGG